MAETIEELNVDWEEEGQLVAETLKKEVLSKGAWTTIMFYYRERDRKTGEWNEPKITIRRYQKVRGNYMQKSKFNFSSEKQARMIAETIASWYDGGGEQPDPS